MRPFTETIHSDFLIHWTGRDIDKKCDPSWNSQSSSNKTDDTTTNQYLERLRSILKHGLWMTKDETPEEVCVNGQTFLKEPVIARTCFTELKLSQVRKHAEKFGRLGIGVKRFYLFDRMGGPMVYIQKCTQNLFFPPYCDWFTAGEEKNEILSFFKHMCSSGPPFTYDLFSESEWRIVYSKRIMRKLKGRRRDDILRLFVDPKRTNDQETRRFYASLCGKKPECWKNPESGKKPEYLIPLDGWFSLIVFPSPQVRIAAANDWETQCLIAKAKRRPPRSGIPDYERQMRPIEMDLDACAHF